MSKSLPAVFAMNCPEDCWLVTSPTHDRGRRTLDHQRLQLDASGEIVLVDDDVPLVPEAPRRRRAPPRSR